MKDEHSSSHFFSSNKIKWIIFFSAVFLLSVVSTWLFWPSNFVWTNDAYIESYNVQVSADIESRITKIHVQEGDFVKKGDLLVDLDRDILEAELVEADTTILLLEELVKKEETFLAKIQDDFFVAKDEFEKNIIAFLDFDHIQKDYLIAKRQVQIAEKALEQGLAKREVVLAKLNHTKIFASRDGFIAKRWIVAGDVATIGAPLFTLNELDFIWITANLEETKLKNVKKGSLVNISIDSYPGRTFTGKVWVVKPSTASKFALIPPSNATGNFTKVVQRIPVKILLERPKDPMYLFPGMSCEVSIKVR